MHIYAFLLNPDQSISRGVLFRRNFIFYSLHYSSQDDVLGCLGPGSVVNLRAHTSSL